MLLPVLPHSNLSTRSCVCVSGFLFSGGRARLPDATRVGSEFRVCYTMQVICRLQRGEGVAISAALTWAA